MEVKKREVLAHESYLQQMLITASIITAFIVSLHTSETHSACNEAIRIAISPFFHWKNPKMRMFA